jgi:microcystin-dependent protein
MSFQTVPRGWLACSGQLLPINQNQALFSLLGTTYGGNGQTNFAIPDLRGRTPIMFGGNHQLGERAGEYAHTVTMSELPQHVHAANATTAQADQNSNAPTPARMPAQSNFSFLYGAPTNLTAMAPNALGNAGGSQAHTNTQPYLVLQYCIAYLFAIFPSQN